MIGRPPSRLPEFVVALTYVRDANQKRLKGVRKLTKQESVHRDVPEPTLTQPESLVLMTMQFALLQRDQRAPASAVVSERKAEVRQRLEADALAHLRTLPDDIPAWCHELARAVQQLPSAQAVGYLESAPVLLGMQVASRARALLLLIELFTFEPWPDGVRWDARSRQQSLAYMAGYLPALDPGDVTALAREFDAVISQLRRRSVRWSKLAAVSILGLGLGALTAGLAAPLIGAAVGSAAGLSGAAASSAGLAALGGGSVAAGGFGVAGGTALVTSLGGLSGVGVAATGARAAGWTTGQLVADTVKLDVITRLVILEAEGDDEQAQESRREPAVAPLRRHCEDPRPG